MRLSNDGIIISDEDDVEVNRVDPKLDECRTLLLYVVKQAIDDYQTFQDRTREDHKELWLTSSGFLFDDDYHIQWGELILNFDQICDLLGLEVDWVRHKIHAQIEVELNVDGVVTTRNK